MFCLCFFFLGQSSQQSGTRILGASTFVNHDIGPTLLSNSIQVTHHLLHCFEILFVQAKWCQLFLLFLLRLLALLRVNSRVSAKIILVLGPNFGNLQSHGSKTPNRLRKFRNGTCNSNNLDEKYGNTGLSTLHFRTLQIFTITQTRKID